MVVRFVAGIVTVLTLTACTSQAPTPPLPSTPVSSTEPTSAPTPSTTPPSPSVLKQLETGSSYTMINSVSHMRVGGGNYRTMRWATGDRRTFIDISDELTGGREFEVVLVTQVGLPGIPSVVSFWCNSTTPRDVTKSVLDFEAALGMFYKGALATPKNDGSGISVITLPKPHDCYSQE